MLLNDRPAPGGVPPPPAELVPGTPFPPRPVGTRAIGVKKGERACEGEALR